MHNQHKCVNHLISRSVMVTYLLQIRVVVSQSMRRKILFIIVYHSLKSWIYKAEKLFGRQSESDTSDWDAPTFSFSECLHFSAPPPECAVVGQGRAGLRGSPAIRWARSTQTHAHTRITSRNNAVECKYIHAGPKPIQTGEQLVVWLAAQAGAYITDISTHCGCSVGTEQRYITGFRDVLVTV